MKKFIIFLLLAVGIILSSNDLNAEPIQTQDGPVCVDTGGASVNVTENGNYSRVNFINYNSYSVSITWSVYGTENNGRTRKVAGGNTLVDHNHPMTDGSTGHNQVNFKCPSDVTGLWVEARVQKCN